MLQCPVSLKLLYPLKATTDDPNKDLGSESAIVTCMQVRCACITEGD